MKYLVLFSLLLLAKLPAQSQIKLPRLVRDSMILQRDKEAKIWGWASPGEKIKINFLNKIYSTKANTEGKWATKLAATKAGGPYTMTINGKNHLVLKDILVGDVWLCAGQSNMVHQMALHQERYGQEIAGANNPFIRQFLVPNSTSVNGTKDDYISGAWKSVNATDILQFSAVAYFFAKKVYAETKVPIGIINASVGGTPIEAWISEGGLQNFDDIPKIIARNKDTGYIKQMLLPKVEKVTEEDKGLTENIKWYDVGFVPKNWRKINVPGYWEDQGVSALDGVVWYRKEISVLPAMTNFAAKMALGRIVDADQVFVNGKLIGQTGYQYPQRRYIIPQGILKEGKNVIVVRVVNNAGKGGFVPDKPYYLATENDTVDLKGTWQYKVGQVYNLKPVTNGFSLQNSPAALYNAMLAPATNFSIKGFVWYQGESNTGEPEKYAKLLPTLIGDWRAIWAQGNLPFVYAQLPNFMEVQYLPSESNWAALRDAQLKALSVANTAMAVTIDLGEWNDIHPENKQDVGERLALQALKIAYDKTGLVSAGPLYKSAVVNGNSITLSFTEIGSGLVAHDGEALSEFAIAGSDKKFVWAKAKIDGDKVIVWNDLVASPMYVRYAWADNPDNPNLYNKEGLPASPFRTDN